MKNTFKYLALFAAAATMVSCANEFDDSVEDGDQYEAGEADFSKYVAVGNSLTAGFADAALYLEGQEDSYPAIMAQQFTLVGGGEFFQPLVADNLGGVLAGGVQILPNRLVLAATPDLGPAVLAGTPTTDITNRVTGDLNNFGVPGAKSFHLGAPGYGNLAGVATGTANPYYVRFASSDNATVIGDAVAADPTFFTLWIGNNDILSFATSGGDGNDRNSDDDDDDDDTGVDLDPRTYGSNDITNVNVFASVYSGYVDALTANGAKGALINIPDVTSIPFFTTVPFNAIPLDGQTAAGVNMAYAQYNGGLLAAEAAGFIDSDEREARTINFVAGQNGPVLDDEDLTDLSALGLPNLRQADEDDLIVFTAATVLGTLADPNNPNSVRGVGVPLEDGNVLTRVEQDRIEDAQEAYNNVIAGIAAQKGLALVDARSFLAQVADGGVAFDGGVLTSTYATGGAFSLDAVHPTPRGYAFTANAILEAINAQYGSTVPPVNIGQYKGVQPSNNVQ
ncbi:SGNH/GDSL hydrolase family protein [Nonlabens ponticola]|uniref:G-D-S-L family lipolytic protein n=1 Tax=Nonlabens ponticola TaxID=2496866 RepID=A0A3S9MV32_9FLAO|nr:SGNH/GDSL hydrolase family protein [Nonlabens ponticola]AZQ42990.1 G-D-S-L family lipolytic protein [Nonlabens ponticola]